MMQSSPSSSSSSPRHYHTIRRSHRSLGLTEVHRTPSSSMQHRHYVVAFRSSTVARHTMYNLPAMEQAVLRQERSGGSRIELPRERLLRAADAHPTIAADDVDGELVVYGSSRLFVPKSPSTASNNNSAHDVDKHLFTMHPRDVFALPFRNVGIVLPTFIEWEDEREMVFECMTVEPCGPASAEAARAWLGQLVSSPEVPHGGQERP